MSIFDKQEWLNAVDDLKAKASNFMQLYDRVYYSTPQTPALARVKKAALEKADTVQSTIQKVTQGIDWTYGKLDEVFGDNTDGTLQELGLVWFIAVPVITSAVAAVTYSISEFTQYLGDNEKIEQLQERGHSLEDSINIVNQPTGIAASIERGMKSYGPWIAAGFVVYLMMQKKGIG
jgi:hypothetical protein